MAENHPKISIITPSLNSGKYIEEAIQSVLVQRYPNFEHVIVDGRSTDETIEVLKKYPHLIWKSEPDKGQSDAMNKGFEMSSGDIIVYLNADDFFLPGAFDAVVPHFECGAKFVVGRLKVLRDNGSYSINDPKITFKEMLRWWEPNAYSYNPVAYFYSREVQEGIKFDVNNQYDMDLEFLLDASLVCDFQKVDRVFGVFRFIEGTKTDRTIGSWRYIWVRLEFYKKYLKYVDDNYQKKYLRDKRVYILQIIFKRPKNTLKKARKFVLMIRDLPANQMTSRMALRNKSCIREMIDPGCYLNKLRTNNKRYYYSGAAKQSHLYSTVYSILLRQLLGHHIEDSSDLLEHINSFQDPQDGLYKDDMLKCTMAEEIDWCGWRDLTAHVVTALTILRGRSKFPFTFVSELYGAGNARRWIQKQDWGAGAMDTSNKLMNYGVSLLYNRDFWNISEAGKSVEEIFLFLDEIQSPHTGLWGGPFGKNTNSLSSGVQTAYHVWNLYFYNKRTINYIDKAIDSCLALQNDFGGFGPGYELKLFSNPFTSACEDIDCIDPLTRFYFLTDYRRNDIEFALLKAAKWVLFNQNPDGGFVFRRNSKFVYGHRFLTSNRNMSDLFSTWFRTLSLAYLSRVIHNFSFFKDRKPKFVDCPGYQFWID